MHKAKLITIGRSQAVRLPREFRFEGDEVCIKRIGSVVVLFDPRDRLKILTGSLGRVTDDFMVDRDQSPTADKRRRL